MKEELGYLYRHIRLDKMEVFYVGISFDDNFKRSRSIAERNNFWKKITAKTDYIVEIVIKNVPKTVLFEKEKYFIKLYGRRNLGLGTLTNLSEGGGCSALGVKRTDETKARLSETHKRENLSPETLKMMSESATGRKLSDETKAKISKASKGKKKSEKAIRNAANSKMKKVVQKNLDGTIVKIWNSVVETAKHGFNKSQVAGCCRGEGKTHRRFIWEYLIVE